jgi:mannonate dehydratase
MKFNDDMIRPMNRRKFFAATATTTALAAAAAPVAQAQEGAAKAEERPRNPRIPLPPPVRAGRMRLGTQNDSSNASLAVLSALGVQHICSTLHSVKMDAAWSVDGLSRLRDRVESYGIHLDMVPLPLSSKYITKAEYPSIMMGKSPERDRAIDDICQMIRNVAKVGIPAVKYNMSVLGVVRSEPTIGRGGATYSTFKFSALKPESPVIEPGPIPADLYWERIEYFLKKVIPVAAENKVKMACHPNDPMVPKVKGYRGVETVLGNADGLKRFITIAENPYHGLNFCQGTICESLENPNKEIHDIIRYFGQRKKIFNVHFRNIEGKFLDFRETLPDNGDVDFLRCIRTYKEVGYDGMMMPDHVPKIEGDIKEKQAFAFAYGYIAALIQMVYSS